MRLARIPSVAAVNPEIEPELEQIVRKSLARDPDDRYEHAADLADALAQYLFSRRMKVTARDIAGLVKDTQIERMRKRSVEPSKSLIDALIQDEMAKVTSLLQAGQEEDGDTGAESLDPSQFAPSHDLIDTSTWTSSFFEDDPSSGRIVPSPPTATSPPPPESPPDRPISDSESEDVSEPEAVDEVESLSQMLEPERTGMHQRVGNSKAMTIAIVVIVMLVVTIGVGFFLFKDRILGDDGAQTSRAPQSAPANQVEI